MNPTPFKKTVAKIGIDHCIYVESKKKTQHGNQNVKTQHFS